MELKGSYENIEYFLRSKWQTEIQRSIGKNNSCKKRNKNS